MANVNISYYRGVSQVPVSTQGQLMTGGACAFEQPQISSETLVTSATAASSKGSPAGTKVVYVQVQPGAFIRYVWNPPGGTVIADGDCPSLSGSEAFPIIGEGWTLSAIDA